MNYVCMLGGLLLAARFGSAQQPAAPPTLPVDTLTHRIAYVGRLAVAGASQPELYARGKRWFATPAPRFITPADFPSAYYLSQADEQRASFLLGQGYASTNLQYSLLLFPARVHVWCTIRLEFEPGACRYALTDFFLHEGPSIHAHQSNLPRGSVEQVCLARRPDGTLTPRAEKFSRGLDQAAQRLLTSLQAGMGSTTGNGMR